MRESNKVPDRLQNLLADPACGLLTVAGNVFPNFGDVLGRLREAENLVRSSARGAFQKFIFALPQRFKEGFSVEGLHPAAFKIVEASIEHLSRAGQFVNQTCHGVLHQLVGGSSAQRRQIIQFLFKLWREMHFHGGRPFISSLKQTPVPVTFGSLYGRRVRNGNR